MKIFALSTILFTFFLVACQPAANGRLPTITIAATIPSPPTEFSTPPTPSVPPPTPPPETKIPTNTATPPRPTRTPALTTTPTLTPTSTIEPTATYWPTVTRQLLSAEQADGLVACEQHTVEDELLLVVTQQFSLPASYVPTDLMPLADYFSDEVTRGQPLFVRATIIPPLQQLIEEMYAVGLRPSILSAYRSYNEQAMAWKWWEGQYPGRVAIMSARPGNSEHQLGTTVDFGSPALNHLFHVDFAGTDEGIWLANNAHRFGFTLSYPADSYSVTGFKYEPWHFRYVGVELAQQLYASDQILTAWQLENLPPPCIP